jgi:LmbE family N-acetylglucosaminyl deacetylase
MMTTKALKKALKQWPRLKFRVGLRPITVTPAQQFAIAASFVLAGTCVFWGVNGANIQLANADQLVNAYLFDSFQTFQGALLPAQHTFLLKWPLFWLISWFHFATWAFAAVTVALVLLTVGGLAFVLRRIERRPAVFGALCLALASVLAMVPIHPQTGVQLPVNMAMVTTRNIEYIVYLGLLALLVTARWPFIKSWRFWSATGLLTILVASDRLFLTLSAGGALVVGVVYLCFRRWAMVRLAVGWLAMTVLAAVASMGLVWLLTSLHVMHIATASDSIWGSYGLVTSVGQAAHGVVYAVLSIFTNFGANPLYDSTLKEIPSHIGERLLSVQGVAYVVNIAVVIAVGIASLAVTMKSMGAKLNVSVQLTITLLASSLASMVAFAASDHYYPVDARYEGIVLFAGFVALATYVSFQKKQFIDRWLKKSVLVLVIGVVASCIGGFQLYLHEKDAQADITARNAKVAQALAVRHITVLVGDYWRVMPIKQAMGNNPLTVVPLSNCTDPRDVLTSQRWQQTDLQHTAFAYLLAMDRPDPSFPDCTLDQITHTYGRPNASTAIAGSLSNPEGTLLYYDYGANHVPLSSTPSSKELATVKPIDIDQFNRISPPSAMCDGKMIVNMVAHQDDDLLFMNPDIIHELKDGKCIRTIYLTAGDDGRGELYWLGRQRGAEQAYNTMLGTPQGVWTHTLVQLADKQFVTIANLIGHPNVGLVFLNLPDGNLTGNGFGATKFESLHKLVSGGIGKIHSVDGQSEYTTEQLTQALTTILQRYKPLIVQAQTPYNMSKVFADHSDHLSVGQLAQKAVARYQESGTELRTRLYIGYPIRARRENVSPADLEQKAAAFFSYAKSDGSVCSTMQLCAKGTAYNFYLRRQYSTE